MLHGERGEETVKHWLFACMVFGLLCAVVYAVGWEHPTDLQAAVRSGDLVRIHILAHDDTQEQQEIKLHVRDAILAAFTPLLQGASSGQEAAQIVQEHLDLAQQTAEGAAEEMGFAQEVRVEFGVFPFPERTYGTQVVPAGEYQALRILLGEAKGRNWWCVMYPPLCFSGEDYEGEVRFESSLAKWLRGIREEIANAFETTAEDGDASGDSASADGRGSGSGGDDALLGEQR